MLAWDILSSMKVMICSILSISSICSIRAMTKLNPVLKIRIPLIWIQILIW